MVIQKKQAVIVNIFDTYEHRVDLLYRCFTELGYDVYVVTSDYKHIDKVKRTEHKEGYTFIESIPYKKNMSFRRMYSHYVLSKDIFNYIEKTLKPDLLWVLVPPNSLAKDAADFKKRHLGVKLVLDMIDLWPETMPLKFFKNLPPFNFWKNLRNDALGYANGIVTECELYHNALPSIYRNKIRTLYLARDIKPVKIEDNINQNEIVLCYLGSINNIIDIDAICDIIKYLLQYKSTTLHIIGDGENRRNLIVKTKQAGANVIYHGKIYDSEKKQEIFNNCHYGLNIMKESVFVGLTMKSMDYFEAGLPIINNIKGDTWNFVEKYNLGFNYEKQFNFYESFVDCTIDKFTIRKFFEDNLSVEVFRRNIDVILTKLD